VTVLREDERLSVLKYECLKGIKRLFVLQEVEAKFEKFGPVKEARIVRNPVNGESRGFGFVSMKYEEDVDAVRMQHCSLLY
jgi:hypothetical protein